MATSGLRGNLYGVSEVLVVVIGSGDIWNEMTLWNEDFKQLMLACMTLGRFIEEFSRYF